MASYLTNCWQRTKTNTSFSCWKNSVQGYATRISPYLNGLFLSVDCNVYNFANDTTPFVCSKNIDLILLEVERNFHVAINWFQNSCMKMNSNGCRFLVAGHKFEKIWFKIGSDLIRENFSIKLLWKTIDSWKHELKFTSYKFKSTSYEFQFTSYKFKSTSYELKSTSSRIIWSIKAQVNSLKTF